MSGASNAHFSCRFPRIPNCAVSFCKLAAFSLRPLQISTFRLQNKYTSTAFTAGCTCKTHYWLQEHHHSWCLCSLHGSVHTAAAEHVRSSSSPSNSPQTPLSTYLSSSLPKFCSTPRNSLVTSFGKPPTLSCTATPPDPANCFRLLK